MQQPAPGAQTPASGQIATGGPENTPEIEKLSIVCATFPQYDWVRAIIGDNENRFDLTLLMDNLVDLHNYQPTVSDIVTIAASDLFIHVGGESDGWVGDVLRQATNPDMIVINLLDVAGDAVKMALDFEGMQDDAAHDHGHSHGHSHSHSHSHAPASAPTHDEIHDHEDEHVWLSLRLAKTICTAITDVLASLDPDNAGEYRSNLASYVDKLSALDMAYQAAVNAANTTTLVFADRFPFRYLMDDYGLSYYAAFSGCSAETEASFSTIVFLATKVEELALNSVMVTESADQSIARTVISSTPRRNQQIHVLNAMQSVTRRDIHNGATYLSIMESNLGVLREALK